ncbi:MraY family glycosyltransferase [Desulfurispora thermophila]|uniref:MraY family glycosyltransferase n=1 Tax=Desulfurispora thermophila TaxID=265470 RepID=UPI00036C1B41|nr:MraY family glycosyltransferase [Desulfurispora thermophila]
MDRLYAVLPLAVILALATTPWVIKKAYSWGALDCPNQRKVHCRVMPRLGGLAVYLSFVPAVLLGLPLNSQIIGLLLGLTIIMALGMTDDIKDISPRTKLLGQILAALLVVPFGIKVGFLTNPLNGQLIWLGWWSVPVTVFWLVAVTNAVNLIDGLDGLAGGVSLIAALTMAAVAWTQWHFFGLGGQYEVIALALLLAAALLGFLRYNFHPARIFLGDSGSMLLGFALAALSVMGLTKSATAISVFLPPLILGIPLLDTFFAIVRRFKQNRPIFQADKEHLHHQLLARGLSHRQTVLVIYGISVLLGASALLLNLLAPDNAVLLLVGLTVLILSAADRLGVLGRRVPEKPAAGQVEVKR